MKNATDFGKEVQRALIDKGMRQKELIERVQVKTNMYFDRSYLYKILTGKYESKHFVEAIKDILDIQK